MTTPEISLDEQRAHLMRMQTNHHHRLVSYAIPSRAINQIVARDAEHSAIPLGVTESEHFLTISERKSMVMLNDRRDDRTHSGELAYLVAFMESPDREGRVDYNTIKAAQIAIETYQDDPDNPLHTDFLPTFGPDDYVAVRGMVQELEALRDGGSLPNISRSLIRILDEEQS